VHQVHVHQGAHAKANMLYITNYITSWGYCDSNVRELHIASFSHLKHRVNEATLPDAAKRMRRIVLAAAFAVTRKCTFSLPYLALMMVGRGPHYQTHETWMMSARLFLGDGHSFSLDSAPAATTPAATADSTPASLREHEGDGAPTVNFGRFTSMTDLR
jgi:hypothetical protein